MIATDPSRSVVEQVRAALERERAGTHDEAAQILQAIDRDALLHEIEGWRGSNAAKGKRSAATVPPANRADANTSIEDKIITFERDHYTCRYCGKQLILVAALRGLSTQHPQVFPCQKNWKLEETHPIYWTHGTICGHITKVVSGGTSKLENLATLCVACMYKENPLQEDAERVSRTTPATRYWRGLSTEFRDLCLVKPHTYQTGDLEQWYKALLAS